MFACDSGAGFPLDCHPDRLRWNVRYASGFAPSFTPHPLAVRALAMDLPDGPVADLARGASGTALLAAARGRHVTAVDISDWLSACSARRPAGEAWTGWSPWSTRISAPGRFGRVPTPSCCAPAGGTVPSSRRRPTRSAAYPEINNATRALRAAAAADGDTERMSLWAGQGYRSATEQSAGEIIERLSAAR
jgi:hypothetical protein